MQNQQFMNFTAKNSEKSVIQRAKAVFDVEIEGLRKVRDELGEPFLELTSLCLKILNNGGKLVFCGVGKSGHIGRKIAATLSSTGSPAVFLHPVEAMHGDLGLLAVNDLLVALSYSGETDELLSVLPAARRFNVPIAAITGNVDSRLAKWSVVTVPMGVDSEACPFNLAPTTTTTALLALGDALAIVLLQCRGFKRDDYAKLHPAGAIGRSVTLRVADVMRCDERFARVLPNALVRDALLVMTGARCGSVAVIDDEQRLLGILTDGDFRRHITDDVHILEKPIKEVMTPEPICIHAEAFAVDLLKLLEERKIDDVLVVDDQGRAVGIVDTQDLPRFKVM